MTDTFVSPTFGRASELGVSLFEETDPMQLWVGASLEELEAVIRATYRQVLGNAYVMESEQLPIPESQLKQGDITVREFVRKIAQSELYRSRFVENCPRYRTIELNFKHLLGRAPESYAEMQLHSQILDQEGFESEIDSYLDSDEYQSAFGEDIVPYYRGYKTQPGRSMIGFSHLFQLLRGAPSSDKNLALGNRSRLNRTLIENLSNPVIPLSSVGTYGGLTDINKLLAEVLKPKLKTEQEVYQEYSSKTESYESLLRQYEEQTQQIAKLQAELADLSPFANIGATGLNKWQSVTSPSSETTSSFAAISTAGNSKPTTSAELQSSIEAQAQDIEILQAKITDSRRFASIGEARLNKWRSRSF